LALEIKTARRPAEDAALVREMSLANPLWGAPRIHGELLKLGIDVGQTTVAKVYREGKATAVPRVEESYRRFLVTAGPVRRRRFRADGRFA
jgi:hypothetical protein